MRTVGKDLALNMIACILRRGWLSDECSRKLDVRKGKYAT